MSTTDDQNTSTETTEQNVTQVAAEQVEEKSLAQELAEANDKTSDDETENNDGEVSKPLEAVDDQKPEDKVEDEKPAESEEEKERKRHNYEQAQKRIQDREQQRRQVEQSIDQAYKPQAVDELTQKFMDDGYDQFQAEMLARDEVRNQREQLNTARTQIAELNMQIETEAVQVMHDYPIFDPNSSEYDKDFATKASAMFERAAGVKTDEKTGVIVSTNLTPYNFYKELAEMRQSGMSVAQTKAQQAAEAQMAAVAPPTSTAPITSKSKEDEEADRLSAAFDKV